MSSANRSTDFQHNRYLVAKLNGEADLPRDADHPDGI